jgi:hypothetical protein
MSEPRLPVDLGCLLVAAPIGCGQVALQRDDRAWLERHRWFSEAFARLNDQAAVPPTGDQEGLSGARLSSYRD